MKHLLMKSVLIYASPLKENTPINYHVYLLTWQQVQHHQGLPTPQDGEWCPLCLSSGFWVDQQSEESNSYSIVSRYSYRSKTLEFRSSDQKYYLNKLNSLTFLAAALSPEGSTYLHMKQELYVRAATKTLPCRVRSILKPYVWFNSVTTKSTFILILEAWNTTVLEFLSLQQRDSNERSESLTCD